jgi:hypothetical protein
MAVIPLTLVISLCLVFTFVIFFLREQSFSRRRFSSAESEALLPLADETPRIVSSGLSRPVAPAPALDRDDDHDHEGHSHAQGGNCGCKDGSRPPCTGCLRRRES